MGEDLRAAMERLVAFVNTRDVDGGTDVLDSPRALAQWLAEQGLIQGPPRATDADLRAAHQIREGLRVALLSHHGHDVSAPGEQPVVSVPLHLVVSADGTVALAPAGGGVAGGLARMLAPIPAAAADGSWSRTKACPDDTCAWAYYDSSRNRSRRWCAMEVCGNREKSRAFRERHRSSD